MGTKKINKKADGDLIIQSVLTFAQFLSKVHVNFPQELFYFLFVFTLTWYLSLFSLQYIANMKVPIIVIIVPGIIPQNCTYMTVPRIVSGISNFSYVLKQPFISPFLLSLSHYSGRVTPLNFYILQGPPSDHNAWLPQCHHCTHLQVVANSPKCKSLT